MALPTVPATVRVDFKYSDGVGNFGSRIFAAYGAGPPTASQINTFCSSVAALWDSTFATMIDSEFTLVQVKGTDLASKSGAEGQWNGAIAGTLSGSSLPSSSCADVLMNIGIRYRGGHPVFHLPPPPSSYLASPRAYTSSYVTNLTTQAEDFLTGFNDLDLPPTNPVAWVVLRGYKSGAVPEAVTSVDVYSAKGRTIPGSMRKRLTSR